MLYIMRHGKTSWNEAGKLQGRKDVPLNEEGRKMAKEAGEKNKDVHLDLCYASPLSRAKETAQLFLKERSVPIILDERLLEMNFGIYEGLTDYFNDNNCPINVLFKNPERYKGAEDGETLEELFQRTGNFLEEVIKPEIAKGKDILIVGHGAMNSAIISQIRKTPLEEFWSGGLENCKLIKLI